MAKGDKEVEKKSFEIKIKSQFKSLQVGYNGSVEPLDKRNDHLDLLAEAIASKSPTLLNIFESIPTQEELDFLMGENFLNENPS